MNNYFVATILFCSIGWSQNTVTITPSVQRYLGAKSTLDRSVYFNHHSSSHDTELDKFRADYRVGLGRGFWGPFSYAKSKTGSVGVYPAAKTGTTQIRNVSRFISTEHPASVIRYNLDKTTAANWVVEYWKNFVNDAGRPEFFEPMNEPFVHAGDADFSAQQSDQNLMRQRMAEWFSEIGLKIHQAPELANMKVVGYASAWPSMELNDFDHWNSRMKMFMDIAGANMDAFSTHLYDGINVTGQDTRRSGSNSEAILDLIEAYSFIKWGKIKDHAITEYGGIEKGYPDDYSDLKSIQSVRSINQILFNLLERQDHMDISIPFITDKATWHITAANNYQPYGAALFIPTNLGEPTPAGWTYSPRVYFYSMWKDVQGERVQIESQNPDIQAQAFVSDNKLFVALNNLDDNNQSVPLTFANAAASPQTVKQKSLKIWSDQDPVFSETNLPSIPDTVTLIPGETTVLEYTFANNINFTNSIKREKFYSNTYLQAIQKNKPISFTFNNVSTGSGKAILRMSLGRKHNVSKSPIITVNGTQVNVPANYKGYNQANRTDFFGMIEVPFSMDLIQNNNTVTLTFPDDGGRVASLILVTEIYNIPLVQESAVFEMIPKTFPVSQTIPVSVTYHANQSRDVVAVLSDPTGTWLGNAKQRVNAGDGTIQLNISLATLPIAQAGYKLSTDIRPVNGDWNSGLARQDTTLELIENTTSVFSKTSFDSWFKIQLQKENITVANNFNGSAIITNLLGHQVQQLSQGNNSIEFLNSGLFFLVVRNHNTTQSFPIKIKH